MIETNKILESNLLFSDIANIAFYQLFKELQKQYDCTYMFFSYEKLDISQRIIFQTDPEWQNYFIDENLISNCPLFRLGREKLKKRKNELLVLPWDFIKPENRLEANVANLRKERKIDHGISIAREYKQIREIFAVASEPNNRNFYSHLLTDLKTLNATLMKAREIALKEMALASKDKITMSDNIITSFCNSTLM